MSGVDQSVSCYSACIWLCLTNILSKKFPGQSGTRYLELVKYAYWSCLQLESDILAELQLPQSGVSRYESYMNKYLPYGIHFSDEEHGVYQTDQKIQAVEVKYYCAQISLRITLNSIHSSLYEKEKLSKYMSHYAPGLACNAPTAEAELTVHSVTIADPKQSFGSIRGLAPYHTPLQPGDGLE